MLGLVGALFGVADKALLSCDDIGEFVGDASRICELLASILEVNGHGWRLRRVTDRFVGGLV